MGIPVVNMGDVIRKEVLKRGLEPNDFNTGMVATQLRKCEGMDAVAIRCISQIKKQVLTSLLWMGYAGLLKWNVSGENSEKASS